MRNEPNFFIVGAPKSGTTALYSYLRQHPQVFMSDLKEPAFFGSDFTGPWFVNDIEVYMSLFSAANEAKCIGEASTTYLYSERAADEIKAFSPNARIIIMLRNPVDMIYALHSERLFEGQEDESDFEEALRLEEVRSQGEHLPKELHLPRQCILYRYIGSYYEQVKRYIEAFSPERVHIVRFDEFRNDVQTTFRGVCHFLDIDPDFQCEFSVVNSNKVVRSQKCARWLRQNLPNIRWAKKLIPARSRQYIFRTMVAANTIRKPREHMPSHVRAMLVAVFSDDVRKLGQMLGWDLSHWMA